MHFCIVCTRRISKLKHIANENYHTKKIILLTYHHFLEYSVLLRGKFLARSCHSCDNLQVVHRL